MAQPRNPNKQVACPQCTKMFKRVCDMAKHHDNLHLDAKLVLVPEGEPSARKKNMLDNLKEWTGRVAVIESNSNGTAVVRVNMSSDTIGSRPRDPTVEKPKVTFTKKKLRCPLLCKRSGLFASPSDVRRHIRDNHPDYDGPLPVARPQPPQPYPCDHCTVSFSKLIKLKRHKQQYHGIDFEEEEGGTESDDYSVPSAPKMARSATGAKMAQASATSSSRIAVVSSAPAHSSRVQPQSSGRPVPLSAQSARPAPSLPPAYAPMQPPVSTTCHNCGQQGHYFRECKKASKMLRNHPVMGGSGNPNLTCRNCMHDGHVAKNCPLPQQQRDMVRQAEDGARRLEELYARVVETQRSLTFLQQQQQAQLGIPASRPGNMMGNMPGNMGGNMPGNMGGNMPGNMGGNMPGNMGGNMQGNMGGNMLGNLGGNMARNMGGNMPGASYGMGGGFSGAPQETPYSMGSQMGMNMGMPFGNVPQRRGQNWYRDT